MAAYAAAVTSALRHAVKVDQVTGVGMYAGVCDLTNYNTTGVEITGITGKFISMITVIADGLSENGYLVRWNSTDLAFHAFYPTNVSDQTPTADIVAAAGLEVASDVDIGEIYFVAYGIT